jgi:hypothetical protein
MTKTLVGLRFKRPRGYYRSVYINAKRVPKLEAVCEYRQTNINDLVMQLIDDEYGFLVDQGALTEEKK